MLINYLEKRFDTMAAFNLDHYLQEDEVRALRRGGLVDHGAQVVVARAHVDGRIEARGDGVITPHCHGG